MYHEIGHNWNITGIYDVSRTRFFDEAFACYYEALGIKKFHGLAAFHAKMEEYRKGFIVSVKQNELNYQTPIKDYGNCEIGFNSYTKGPWALYVFNNIVGEECFLQIIHTFIGEFKDIEVTFEDFKMECEKVSKISLTDFFERWIYSSESSDDLVRGLTIDKL